MLLLLPRLSSCVCLLILSHAHASRKSPFLCSVVRFCADKASQAHLPLLLSVFSSSAPYLFCLSPFCVQSKGEAGRRYPSLPYPFYSFFFQTQSRPFYSLSHCQLFLPATHCSMLLLSPARFALSSSFIDHVYDMTGTPLAFLFSSLEGPRNDEGRGGRKHLIALG